MIHPDAQHTAARPHDAYALVGPADQMFAELDAPLVTVRLWSDTEFEELGVERRTGFNTPGGRVWWAAYVSGFQIEANRYNRDVYTFGPLGRLGTLRLRWTIDPAD